MQQYSPLSGKEFQIWSKMSVRHGADRERRDGTLSVSVCLSVCASLLVFAFKGSLPLFLPLSLPQGTVYDKSHLSGGEMSSSRRQFPILDPFKTRVNTLLRDMQTPRILILR